MSNKDHPLKNKCTLPVLSIISTTAEEGSPIVTLESLVSITLTLKLSRDSEILSGTVRKLVHWRWGEAKGSNSSRMSLLP